MLVVLDGTSQLPLGSVVFVISDLLELIEHHHDRFSAADGPTHALN